MKPRRPIRSVDDFFAEVFLPIGIMILMTLGIILLGGALFAMLWQIF